MAVSGISSAMGFAVYGIRGAIERFDAATTDVVMSAARMSDSAQFSSAALDKAKSSMGSEGSLEKGLVDQRLASHELSADISVVRTADEMLDTLTHLGDDRTRR
jgi:hypothetical protein